MTERVLLVKTSSLGDVVHLLPALSEAAALRGDLRFDWVVEAPYADLVACHEHVDRVIPVALRRWRRALGRADTWQAAVAARAALRQRRYAAVVDAQGLIKSAVLAAQAHGPRWGFDAASVRERPAAWRLDHACAVPRQRHAIDRLRSLLGTALNYTPGRDLPATGLRLPGDAWPALPAPDAARTLVLQHGTAWPSKHWPEAFWSALARDALQRGLLVLLPWGHDAERQRAQRIAAGAPGARVLDALTLVELAALLSSSTAVVGVDSGVTHLAALLGRPTVGLFGPTDAALTGLRGPRVRTLLGGLPCAPCGRRLCQTPEPVRYMYGQAVEAPCFAEQTPARVLAAVEQLLPAPPGYS